MKTFLVVALACMQATVVWAQAAPAQPASPQSAAPPSAKAAAPASPTPPATRSDAAVTEFIVDGEDSTPALTMQLQDGFVLGLALSGTKILDPMDVARRLAATPELLHCDTSGCFKAVGHALSTRYVLRVKVNVSGNNYRATARLFLTEGATPTVLPVETRQRSCDVCTVAEARSILLRLAEDMKKGIEPAPLDLVVAQLDSNEHLRKPALISLAAGIVAIAAGSVWLASSSDLSRGSVATAGALIGTGVTVTGIALFVVLDSTPRSAAGSTVALGASWRW
jgi:hypothetical protein